MQQNNARNGLRLESHAQLFFICMSTWVLCIVTLYKHSCIDYNAVDMSGFDIEQHTLLVVLIYNSAS